jgi:acetylornithine/succinyldiaminopimelate/putrescine aminotransferase
MDFHEAYTVRMFHSGQIQFQEEEFQAMSPTEAYECATKLAEAAGASHFNVSKGKIDREKATAIQVSRKK